MLNKPEEFIMAVLAGIWVVITFIICRYLHLPTDTGLLVTTLTLIWALVFFLLWQRGRTCKIWPVFLGLLVCAGGVLFTTLLLKLFLTTTIVPLNLYTGTAAGQH